MKPYDVLTTTYQEDNMPKQGSTFVQLSEENRKQISRWKKEKKKNAEIARLLSVHRSTISRETRDSNYAWTKTHRRYVENKKRCGRKSKVCENPKLVKYIEEQVIKKRWSPHVAIEYARKNNLYEITFSDRSVYNWVRKGLIKITPMHLRYSLRRKQYVKRIKENKRMYKGKSISERPNIVNSRQEFGHWEIDCIIDGCRKAILVMQERQTRKFEMAKLERHDSHHALVQVKKWMSQFGSVIKSITADNGWEFARLHELGTEVYFTRPFAPHEKGGVENLNGRIRWDIPKSKFFHDLPESRLAEIQDNINQTPRQILNFRSPSQAFCDIVNSNTSCCI